MTWIQRLIDHVVGTSTADPAAALDRERERTRQSILRTMAFAMEVRDAELEIIEHSALVAMLCDTLGRRMGLSEPDLYILEKAAHLHEAGMFSVPAALLLRSTPLSLSELAQVRAQAKASAELAETMHHPRVAMLIAHQYDDYLELRDQLSEQDLLLAGILRVADVVAAVTRPRPYQDALALGDRALMLEDGAGIRFHPLAVQSALRLGDGETTLRDVVIAPVSPADDEQARSSA